MAYGPAAGLELVDALTDVPALRGYHLLPSVRGDLLAQARPAAEARAEFARAASLTRNERERALLLDARPPAVPRIDRPAGAASSRSSCASSSSPGARGGAGRDDVARWCGRRPGRRPSPRERLDPPAHLVLVRRVGGEHHAHVPGARPRPRPRCGAAPAGRAARATSCHRARWSRRAPGAPVVAGGEGEHGAVREGREVGRSWRPPHSGGERSRQLGAAAVERRRRSSSESRRAVARRRRGHPAEPDEQPLVPRR